MILDYGKNLIYHVVTIDRHGLDVVIHLIILIDNSVPTMVNGVPDAQRCHPWVTPTTFVQHSLASGGTLRIDPPPPAPPPEVVKKDEPAPAAAPAPAPAPAGSASGI